MLPYQVPDLAHLRSARIARWDLAADVGVEVGACAGAVAVGRDGGFVDVVY